MLHLDSITYININYTTLYTGTVFMEVNFKTKKCNINNGTVSKHVHTYTYEYQAIKLASDISAACCF